MIEGWVRPQVVVAHQQEPQSGASADSSAVDVVLGSSEKKASGRNISTVQALETDLVVGSDLLKLLAVHDWSQFTSFFEDDPVPVSIETLAAVVRKVAEAEDIDSKRQATVILDVIKVLNRRQYLEELVETKPLIALLLAQISLLRRQPVADSELDVFLRRQLQKSIAQQREGDSVGILELLSFESPEEALAIWLQVANLVSKGKHCRGNVAERLLSHLQKLLESGPAKGAGVRSAAQKLIESLMLDPDVENTLRNIDRLSIYLKMLKQLSAENESCVFSNAVKKAASRIQGCLADASQPSFWKAYCQLGRAVGLPLNYEQTLTLANHWMDVGRLEKGKKCLEKITVLEKSGSRGKRTLETILRCSQAFFDQGQHVRAMEVLKKASKWSAGSLPKVVSLWSQLFLQAPPNNQAFLDVANKALSSMRRAPAFVQSMDAFAVHLRSIENPGWRTTCATQIMCALLDVIEETPSGDREVLLDKLSSLLMLCDFSDASDGMPIAKLTKRHLQMFREKYSILSEDGRLRGWGAIEEAPIQMQLLRWYGRLPEDLRTSSENDFFVPMLDSTVTKLHKEVVARPSAAVFEAFHDVHSLLVKAQINPSLFENLAVQLIRTVIMRCRHRENSESTLAWLEVLMTMLEECRDRIDYAQVHFLLDLPSFYLGLRGSCLFDHNPVMCAALEERFMALIGAEGASTGCLESIGLATTEYIQELWDDVRLSSSNDYPHVGHAYRLASAFVKRENELSAFSRIIVRKFFMDVIRLHLDPFGSSHCRGRPKRGAILLANSSLVDQHFRIAAYALVQIHHTLQVQNQESSEQYSASALLEQFHTPESMPDIDALRIHPLFINGVVSSVWHFTKWMMLLDSPQALAEAQKVLSWMIEAVLANMEVGKLSCTNLDNLRKVMVFAQKHQWNEPVLADSLKKIRRYIMDALLSWPLDATGIKLASKLFRILDQHEAFKFFKGLLEVDEHLAACTLVESPYWPEGFSEVTLANFSDAVWDKESFTLDNTEGFGGKKATRFLLDRLDRGLLLLRYCPLVINKQSNGVNEEFEYWFTSFAALCAVLFKVQADSGSAVGGQVLYRFLNQLRLKLRKLLNETESFGDRMSIVQTWIGALVNSKTKCEANDAIQDLLRDESIFWDMYQRAQQREHGPEQVVPAVTSSSSSGTVLGTGKL